MSRYQTYPDGGILDTLQKDGMTIIEVAEILGVTRRTIINWANSNSFPHYALNKLGFELSYTFKEEEQ